MAVSAPSPVLSGAREVTFEMCICFRPSFSSLFPLGGGLQIAASLPLPSGAIGQIKCGAQKLANVKLMVLQLLAVVCKTTCAPGQRRQGAFNEEYSQ